MPGALQHDLGAGVGAVRVQRDRQQRRSSLRRRRRAAVTPSGSEPRRSRGPRGGSPRGPRRCRRSGRPDGAGAGCGSAGTRSGAASRALWFARRLSRLRARPVFFGTRHERRGMVASEPLLELQVPELRHPRVAAALACLVLPRDRRRSAIRRRRHRARRSRRGRGAAAGRRQHDRVVRPALERRGLPSLDVGAPQLLVAGRRAGRPRARRSASSRRASSRQRTHGPGQTGLEAQPQRVAAAGARDVEPGVRPATGRARRSGRPASTGRAERPSSSDAACPTRATAARGRRCRFRVHALTLATASRRR